MHDLSLSVLLFERYFLSVKNNDGQRFSSVPAHSLRFLLEDTNDFSRVLPSDFSSSKQQGKRFSKLLLHNHSPLAAAPTNTTSSS
jgi:hypothetical protein